MKRRESKSVPSERPILRRSVLGTSAPGFFVDGLQEDPNDGIRDRRH